MTSHSLGFLGPQEGSFLPLQFRAVVTTMGPVVLLPFGPAGLSAHRPEGLTGPQDTSYSVISFE